MAISGASRLARGASTASIAIFAALVSHVAAGGAMPGAVGIAVPWILALPITVALVGRRLPLLRLSLGVAASQALFHALFVLGAPAAGDASVAMHGHHATIVLGAPSPTVGPDIAMLALHAIAAVATIAYVHLASHAARAVLTAADRWLRRLVLSPVELPELLVHRVGPRPVTLVAAVVAAPRTRGPPSV